jgi:mRNA interferase RelE/StbE
MVNSYGGVMSNGPVFKIALSREALKYYNKVSTNTAAKLDKCFSALENDPIQGPNLQALKGFTGKYRYKAGNLRIIYAVDIQERIVYIIAILPRGQAYKRIN